MGHFLRIRKCCCCGGGLRGGSIAIGVFYLLIAFFGTSIDDVSFRNTLQYGAIPVWPSYTFRRCGEVEMLQLWEFSCLVSVVINLIMVCGALLEQPRLVAPWLAWHIALPFVHLTLILWSIIGLTSCRSKDLELTEAVMAIVLVTSAVTLLPLVYFATVVYSLYKDLSEGKRSNKYGANTLLPSKNWDTALRPYTAYDPEQATPTDWGYLQPQQQTYQAAGQRMAPPPPPPQQLQRQRSGIPRPQSQIFAA